MHTVDTDFHYACLRAAGMIKSKKSRQARIDATCEVVAILLSERAIGPGERQLLADLLTGELDRPHSRPALSAQQRQQRRERVHMVRQYQDEKAAAGRKISIADAVQAMADENRLTADDVEKLINFMSRSQGSRT